MRSKSGAKRSGQTTRQRILKAAGARFARSSYEEVKLRDIASDVGVDVAYVCRSFGSKQQLLVEVFKATAHTAQSVLATDKDDLVGAFSKHMLGPESMGLRIFSCSLSSAKARTVLRPYIMKTFVEPLAAQLSGPALLRACFVAACLVGIKVQRDVLRLKPLASAPHTAFMPLFEAIMKACVETDVPLPRRNKAPQRRRLNGSASRRKTAKDRAPSVH